MTADTGDDGDDEDGSGRPEGGEGESTGRADDGSGESSGRADDGLGETSGRVERGDEPSPADERDREAPGSGRPSGLADEVDELRGDLDALETRIDEKTVHRDDIRAELKRYVRKRQRRGHATGWGPYLVLLYGTVMTVAAFYYLGEMWAVLSMGVVWLSTLGLYVLMLFVGAFLGIGRRLVGMRDLLGKLRR